MSHLPKLEHGPLTHPITLPWISGLASHLSERNNEKRFLAAVAKQTTNEQQQQQQQNKVTVVTSACIHPKGKNNARTNQNLNRSVEIRARKQFGFSL